MILAGGGVKGGRILGSFPDRLGECDADCPLNIGRGRIIPQLPWESVWNGLAEWCVSADYILLDFYTTRQLPWESVWNGLVEWCVTARLLVYRVPSSETGSQQEVI